MKATIERATLLRCLSHVQSVVERRNTIPILSNVLIEAAPDNTVRIMATDLDLQVVESMPRSASTAPARSPFRRICCSTSRANCPTAARSALTPPTTRWWSRPGAAGSRCRRCRATISRSSSKAICRPASNCRRATLAQLIDRTRFAISTEETRYYLNGIFLHVADDELKAAATDGHRLARYTLARPEGAEGMPDVIVPRKCVAELRKLLEEVQDTRGADRSVGRRRSASRWAAQTAWC